MARNVLDKAGSIGTLLSAAAIPCCFPFLSFIGSAAGLSVVLFRYQRWMSYLIVVSAVIAVVGGIIAFRGHRKPAPLVVSAISAGLLIYGVNAFLYTNYIYPGIIGLFIAAIWNTIETRRCANLCKV